MSDKAVSGDSAADAMQPSPEGSFETDAASASPEEERGNSAFAGIIASVRRWWLAEVVGAVDQVQVIADRREECLLSERYLFMTAMSAGIAVVGLLQSSTAVVIGAMLLSPLMGPIMGLGFA